MDSTPSLLLVAGPGLGHITGSFHLAKALLSTGLTVVVAWFARSYRVQQNRLPVRDAAIRFEVLDDGSVPGSQNYQNLFAVTPEMKQSLAQLIERLSLEDVPACCIISDTFMPWTQSVADQFQIPRVDYWTANATAYSMILVLPELISRRYIPQKDSTTAWKSENPILIDCMPGYTQFPLEEIPKELRIADLSDPFLQTFLDAAAAARKAERILIHSVYELESNAFDGLRESQYPVYAIGPLLKYESDSSIKSDVKQEYLKWLDTQSEDSVIYVSFGSNALLSNKDILELASGLEASGQPFLLVVRSDQANGDVSNLLPAGFESRNIERGRIVSWVSQVTVLSHRAVGGFMTHCGWNSTLESICAGVPLLGCPLQADQRTNARFMSENWGMGIEVGRTKEGGLEREEVARAVKALMIGKEGKDARRKAGELRESTRKNVQPGGLSQDNLLNFAKDMCSLYSAKARKG